MRTLLAIAIAVGLTSVADVKAAVTKKTEMAEATITTKAKKKKAKKGEASKEAVKAKAVVAEPVKAEAPVAAAPAEQTTTAAAATVAPKPLKKWGASIWSENYAKMVAVNKRQYNSETSDFESDNLLTLSYKANPELSFSANTWLNINPGLGDNKAKTEATDLYLSVTKTNLAKLGRTTAINFNGRVYLPTSEMSYNMGLIAHLRAYVTLEKKIGNLTVGYVLNPRFFAQNYLTWFNKDLPPAGAVTGTPYFYLVNILEMGYDLNAKWSLQQYIGYANRWFHGDSSLAKPIAYTRKDSAIYGSFVQFNANPNLTLLLGVEANGWGATMNNVNGPADNIYRDDNTDYKLVVNVKI